MAQRLIATGTPTAIGWLVGWNTTSVPNGTYRLQTVAYDSAGKSGARTSITLTIANELTQ